MYDGAVSMLPACADSVLHIESEGLGALRAAPALGAVGMTLWFALRPMKIMRTASLFAWAVGSSVFPSSCSD